MDATLRNLERAAAMGDEHAAKRLALHHLRSLPILVGNRVCIKVRITRFGLESNVCYAGTVTEIDQFDSPINWPQGFNTLPAARPPAESHTNYRVKITHWFSELSPHLMQEFEPALNPAWIAPSEIEHLALVTGEPDSCEACGIYPHGVSRTSTGFYCGTCVMLVENGGTA